MLATGRGRCWVKNIEHGQPGVGAERSGQVRGGGRDALGLQETVLGKQHPDALRSMSNLENVLGDQGKYEQAEEMHRQALGLRETVLIPYG
jgi:Tetratricopeptide repeat